MSASIPTTVSKVFTGGDEYEKYNTYKAQRKQ